MNESVMGTFSSHVSRRATTRHSFKSESFFSFEWPTFGLFITHAFGLFGVLGDAVVGKAHRVGRLTSLSLILGIDSLSESRRCTNSFGLLSFLLMDDVNPERTKDLGSGLSLQTMPRMCMKSY